MPSKATKKTRAKKKRSAARSSKTSTKSTRQSRAGRSHGPSERGGTVGIASLARAHVALRQSNERFRTFLDHAPSLAFVKGTDGRYLYANRKFEEVFHLPIGSLLGKTDIELFSREQAARFQAHDREVLESGQAFEFEDKEAHADGLHTSIVVKFPLRDAVGQICGIGGIVTDITDRKRIEEDLKQRVSLSDFVEEVSLSLNRNEPLNLLLQRCAEAVTIRLGSAFARIWVLGPGDLCGECHKAEWCKDRTQCLHLLASAGLSSNLNGEYRRVPLGAFKIGQIGQGAGAMTTNDILQDERLPNKKWMRENGLQSFAGYPLVVEGRVYGVLGVFGREPLSTAMLQTLESVCHGIATAIARKQAEETLHLNQRELRRHQAQLQDLTSKLITAQERERQRISRELHDDFSQRLAALVLDVAALEQQPPLMPEFVPNALEPIRNQLEQLSDDIHNLAYRLHPSLLEHAGLQPAIEDHIHQITQRTGLRITLKASEIPGWLSLDHSTSLFRVLQESLQNIVKHANATDVMVKLSGSPNGVGLSVIDNGRGFDTSDKSAHQQKGLGLISMQERMRLLNGFLRINSRPADGTKVCAWIPSRENGV